MPGKRLLERRGGREMFELQQTTTYLKAVQHISFYDVVVSILLFISRRTRRLNCSVSLQLSCVCCFMASLLQLQVGAGEVIFLFF